MGFKANHKSIEHFSERLDKLTGDAHSAESYVEQWLSFGYADGGIFLTVVETAEDAKQALLTNYQRLAEMQRSAAAEVDKAAVLYTRTDQDEAARLDNSYNTSD